MFNKIVLTTSISVLYSCSLLAKNVPTLVFQIWSVGKEIPLLQAKILLVK